MYTKEGISKQFKLMLVSASTRALCCQPAHEQMATEGHPGSFLPSPPQKFLGPEGGAGEEALLKAGLAITWQS